MAKPNLSDQVLEFLKTLKKNISTAESAAILQETLDNLKSSAIAELLQERQQVDALLADLGYEAPAADKRRGRRGPMSAETKEKMRQAWQKRKAATGA